MKLMVKPQKIESEGVIETQEFGIRFNAKLVKILSDGLYSDKITALLRELAANATDAHTENDKSSTPIDINLPSQLDPTFYIRDYGKGLSPEQIKEVYTIYGESTKEDSNDAIGCLGLGSKTPFCYNTRSCTVNSWYDGIHYIYTAYLNEEGMPVLSKLSEEPSTEPSGIKISLSVNKNDIGNFAEKAKAVFRYYKVKPRFLGNRITPSEIKYVFQGKGWALREQNNYQDFWTAIAVMGQIGYPITLNDANLTDIMKQLLGCKVDLFFDIGELDIEASREGLSFDTRTKTNIVKKLQQVCSEIEILITSKISTSKSMWDARCNFKDLNGTLPQAFFKVITKTNIEWDKKKLFPNTYSYKWEVSTTDEITYYEARTNYSSTAITSVGSHKTKHLDVDRKVKFVDADLKTGNIKRIKDWIIENNFKEPVYLLSFDDTIVKQRWMDEIGILSSDVELASSLQVSNVPVATVRNPGVKRGHSTAVMKWKSYDIFKTKCWENTQYDLANGGMYSEINNFDLVLPTQKEMHPMHVSTVKDHLTTLGITTSDLYGIKSATLPKVSKSGGTWKTFYQLCEETINSFLKTHNLKDYMLAVMELGKIGNYDYSSGTNIYHLSKSTILDLKGKVKPKTVFANYIEKVEEYDKLLKVKDKFDAISGIKGLMDIKTLQKSTLPKYDLQKEQRTVYQTYPILRHLSATIDKKDIDHVAIYINNV